MNRDAILKKHYDLLAASLSERRPEIVAWLEYEKAVPEEAPSVEVMDGLAQKALVLLLKAKLDAEPALNQRFHPQTKVALWNQLLLAARIKELSRAKIVKKGGKKQLRYDIGDLVKTFYGKQLVAAAGLGRNFVLDKDEIEKLNAECAKVKLTLPEHVEPTTTERFFDEIEPEPKPPRASKPKKKKAKANP